MADYADQIRSVLIKNISNQYHALANSIGELPISNELKHSIIFTLGSAYLWAKDGIMSVDFSKLEKPEDPIPEEEPNSVTDDLMPQEG